MAGRIYVRAALARNFTRCVDTIKAIGGGFPAGPDSRHSIATRYAQKRRVRIWWNHTTNRPAFGVTSLPGGQSLLCDKKPADVKP